MASSAIYQIQTLSALFKETYADQVENAIPERELLFRSTPFVSQDKAHGNEYNQPVILSRMHAVTYLGSNDDNLQITPPTTSIVKNATIRGSAMMMSGLLSITAASRATKGGNAFVDATSYLVEALTDSFSAVHEQTFWYGKAGLVNVTTASSEISSLVFTVTPENFAPAIWIGAEGMRLDRYSSAGVYQETHEVSTVDITRRKITFVAVTGTIADGDIFYRSGANGLEAQGLESILTTSGSLFGINNSTYGLWAGSRAYLDTNGDGTGTSQYASFQKVADGIAIAYSRGLEGSMDLHVNPRVFTGLIPDFLTSKTGGGSVQQGRYFDSAQEVERLTHGSRAISFVVNNVECNLLANDYVKGKYMFGLSQGNWMRVGSSDATFDIPGSSEKGEYFRQLESIAGLELRMFSDQAIFTKSPAKNILFSNVKVV